jgi:hypothetical protein
MCVSTAPTKKGTKAVVRTSYFRTTTLLVAMMAAVVMAVLVAYGSASAEIPPPPPGDIPTVIKTLPADNATNVDRDANIKAKLSEKMLKTTVNKNTVRLYEENLTYDNLNSLDPPLCDPGPNPDPGSNSQSAKVSYNAKKKLAVLNPEARLEAKTEYTALVDGAGDCDQLAAKDNGGTEMATDYIWHFTTGEN